MLLALACGNSFVISGAVLSSAEERSPISDNESANLFKNAFFDLGERPIWVEGSLGSGELKKDCL